MTTHPTPTKPRVKEEICVNAMRKIHCHFCKGTGFDFKENICFGCAGSGFEMVPAGMDVRIPVTQILKVEGERDGKDKYYQENWDFNKIFSELQLGTTQSNDIRNRGLITDWIWQQYKKTKQSHHSHLLSTLRWTAREKSQSAYFIAGGEDFILLKDILALLSSMEEKV